MKRKVILFSACEYSIKAINFFGVENIICYVDNDISKKGKIINGIDVISFEDLLKKYVINNEHIDIVISLSVEDRIWTIFTIANQLIKNKIENFSVLDDVMRRWKNSGEFLSRDTDIFLSEHESILNLYKYQNKYLMRHVDPSTMRKATGALRSVQLNALDASKKILEIAEQKYGIKAWMSFGTLLGAVRHGGFIPWDDDLDFVLPIDDYLNLQKKLHEHEQFNVFVQAGGSKKFPYTPIKSKDFQNKSEFFILDQRCWMRIFKYSGKSILIDNDPVCDIFPLYYYPNSYSVHEFYNDYLFWLRIRRANYDQVDDIYYQNSLENKHFLTDSSKIGCGHNLTSYTGYGNQMLGKGVDCKALWDVDCIFPLQKIKFEEELLWAPANPDKYLRQVYGEYKTLPFSVGICEPTAQVRYPEINFFSGEY